MPARVTLNSDPTNGWFFGMVIGSEIVGTAIAIFIAVIWGLISWFVGDRIVLSVNGARELKKSDNPYLYNISEGLAIAAGVPAPKMYIIDDSSPNAFATGRDPQHSSIAVTTGLLKMMDRSELEGVIAHEMSHIRNYDIRTMMIAAVLVGIISLLGQLFIRIILRGGGSRGGKKGGASAFLLVIGILFIIVSPFIAQLIKMAISRKREYLADASAVELTRNPDGLKDALQKLANDHTSLKRANGATAHLFIEDPIDKEKGLFAKLGGMFSTHPPMDDRIKRLGEMGMMG